jgi:hypothetical protein
VTVLGASDCEQARVGTLTQPVNALTSLAFVPAGVLSMVAAARASGRLRRRLVCYAGALLAVGVGSFTYHGPQPTWAGRAHDGSIVCAVACAFLVRAGLGGRRNRIWPTRPGKACAVLTAAAVAAYAGGRTGSPLCDPDSRIQLHGAWHALTAGSAVAFAWAAASAHRPSVMQRA